MKFNMLDKFFPLYLTVFFTTLILTALTVRRLTPRLSRSAQQPIYSDGPAWHEVKHGTPTMGGLAFLFAIGISLLISSLLLIAVGERESGVSLLSVTLFSVLNSSVGVIDDITKLKRKKNKGLSPLQKLLIQFLIAAAFVTVRAILSDEVGEIFFSFGRVNLGFMYYPISIFLLLGIINCANLTDGIDGLATSVAFAAAVSLFYISASLFPDTSLVCSAVIGAAVGFLIFNINPAKIFMGDTGSLFFGALLSSAVFSMKNPFIILFVGGVYVIEGVSVVLQVIFFKTTGRRVFKMAPIHHHLEKCGFSENRICIIAILATLIFSIPAFIFYLP